MKKTSGQDPVDVSQPLSLATLVLVKRDHEWNSHGDRDGGYAQALQHHLSLPKVDLATAAADIQPISNKDQYSGPQYGTILQGGQPATDGHLGHSWNYPSWKWQQFILTRIGTYSGYIICLSCLECLH